MSEDFIIQLLEVQITLRLALVEATRPDNPLPNIESGWGPDPTAVMAYEVRLRRLHGAVVAMRGASNSSRILLMAQH